jgi:type II secretory pathway component GspD/PulD (secretin)
MEVEVGVRGPAISVRRSIRVLAVVILLGVTATLQAQQTVLEVIDLKYRSAEQIVPMLRPLLAPGGTISALQNRLIVRTTPQNLAELRKVLDAVDAKPKRLVISVRQEVAETGLASEAEVSGSIGSDSARVTVPGSRSKQGANAEVRKGDNVVRGRVLSSQSAATAPVVQTVQVQEGNEALIRIGQSVPVRSGNVIQTPQGAQIAESVEYHEVDSGFRVRPRLNGDQVMLEISSRRDSVAHRNTEAFNIQHVDTVISGRLGEWMEVGGVGQSRMQADSGTISRRSASVSDDRKVFLKVDLVP